MQSNFNLTDRFWHLFPGSFDIIQDFFNGKFYQALNSNLLNNYPHQSILELGCGVGSLLKHLKPRHYIGVDISQDFIRVAQRQHQSNKNYQFVCHDALTYTTNQSFDIIIGSSFSHHLSDNQLKHLFTHLSSKIKFKYLLIVDGKPAKTFWKPLLELLDAGAKFREANQVSRLLPKTLKLVKKGKFISNRPFYYYPYILAKKS
jgi:SAM-dependent methyltransferase